MREVRRCDQCGEEDCCRHCGAERFCRQKEIQDRVWARIRAALEDAPGAPISGRDVQVVPLVQNAQPSALERGLVGDPHVPVGDVVDREPPEVQ